MDGAGRRWKGRDPAGGEGGGSFSGTAHLKYRYVFIRLQSQSFEQHPRRHVRGAADAADADAFAFELLRRADRFMDDQLIGKRVDETADGDEIGAADNRVGDGAAGDIADFDRPGNQSGDVGRRGRNED